MKAVVIRLSAEKDEFALHHVLGLEPILGGTATIELLARLETMPSSPSSAAALKNLRPSQSPSSPDRIGERDQARPAFSELRAQASLGLDPRRHAVHERGGTGPGLRMREGFPASSQPLCRVYSKWMRYSGVSARRRIIAMAVRSFRRFSPALFLPFARCCGLKRCSAS